MYRVTMQADGTDQLQLRVANEDLGRILALAARVQRLNPALQVAYAAEAPAQSAGAA